MDTFREYYTGPYTFEYNANTLHFFHRFFLLYIKSIIGLRHVFCLIFINIIIVEL